MEIEFKTEGFKELLVEGYEGEVEIVMKKNYKG